MVIFKQYTFQTSFYSQRLISPPLQQMGSQNERRGGVESVAFSIPFFTKHWGFFTSFMHAGSVIQLCPTPCDPTDSSLPGSSVHGDSPGKNTGVGCQDLFQGIFLTQGSNPGFPHGRWILYHLSYQGNTVGELKPCMQCGQKNKR